MVQRRTKVSLFHWRKTVQAMSSAMRDGDRKEASKHAHTLLSYLTEMGLLDDLDRQGTLPTRCDRCNDLSGEAEAKMKKAS